MGFRSRRASLDREEGLTPRLSQRFKRRGRSSSTADHSTRPSERRRSSTSQRIRNSAKRVRRSFSDARNSFNSYEHPEYGVTGSEPMQIHNGLSGEGGNAAGTGARERFSDAFNKYRPPDYGGPRDNENTDSESEKRNDGSSGEESSDASTAPSSVGSQTPSASSPPSRVASPAPSTSPGSETTTYGPKKKNVHFPFPDGFDPPSKMTAFDALPQEEKIRLRNAPYENNPEVMKLIEVDQYQAQNALNNARETYDAAHKASKAIASGEKPPDTDTRPPISLWAIRHCAEKLMEEVTKTYGAIEAVTQETIEKTVRGLLPAYMGERYTGPIDSVQWPEGWKDTVKAPDDVVTGPLLTYGDLREYKKKYLEESQPTINGKPLTAEQASQWYDETQKHRVVTINRADPIYSKLSAFGGAKTPPPDFKTIEQNAHLLARVKDLKEIEDKTLAGGGTHKDVQKAWELQYGAKVEGTDHGVSFYNLNEGTITGKMDDGTEVTMTCGNPTTPPSQRSVDIGQLGPNPFVSVNWEEDKKAAEEYTVKKEKLDEKRREAASKQGMEKAAKATAEAPLTPLPSINGAKTLTDVPKLKETDPFVSWNGHSLSDWMKGHKDDAQKTTSLYNRSLTMYKHWHLKPPECDDKTAVQLATWVADGQDLKDLAAFFEARGIPFDKETNATLWKSRDRPMSASNQKIRDWATSPSSLPISGSLPDSVAHQRVVNQWDAASEFTTHTSKQRVKLGTFLADQTLLASVKMEPDAVSGFVDSLKEKISAKLLKTPTWEPDQTTTAKSLLGSGTT